MPKVLNVGGNSRSIQLPDIYVGYQQLLLDIDPRGEPDIVCDARELGQLEPAQFDAVYCSHNLEHYFQHDVSRVLSGFRHIVKQDGFVHIRVPDLLAVFKSVLERNLELDAELYLSPSGPISPLDVIYGYGKEIAQSGQDWYAHKTGFSEPLLVKTLHQAGFTQVYSWSGNLEIGALAFLNPPTPELKLRLNLPD